MKRKVKTPKTSHRRRDKRKKLKKNDKLMILKPKD